MNSSNKKENISSILPDGIDNQSELMETQAEIFKRLESILGTDPRFKKQCPRCGNWFSDEVFEKHHIIPKSEGGTDWELNLIEVCLSCHREIHCTIYPEME